MYTKTVDKQLIKKQVTYIFVKTAQMRKLKLSSSKVEDILNEYLDKQISRWADRVNCTVKVSRECRKSFS